MADATPAIKREPAKKAEKAPAKAEPKKPAKVIKQTFSGAVRVDN